MSVDNMSGLPVFSTKKVDSLADLSKIYQNRPPTPSGYGVTRS